MRSYNNIHCHRCVPRRVCLDKHNLLRRQYPLFTGAQSYLVSFPLGIRRGPEEAELSDNHLHLGPLRCHSNNSSNNNNDLYSGRLIPGLARMPSPSLRSASLPLQPYLDLPRSRHSR